jgi:excisionase family DNA binding protein
MDLIQVLRERKSYLTTKEVMQLLRCQRNTLCEWVRTNRIPAVRSGNGYLYDPNHLAEWLAQRSTVPGRKREAR